jgi:uncharacterized Tic20 family protein
MRHLKGFKSFSINENNSSMEDIVSSKIESLSDSEIEQVKQDLLKLADNIGLSPEDLTDEEKVKAALDKSGMKIEPLVNEGLKETWDKIKGKFGKMLLNFGLGGLVSSIVTLALGAGMQSGAVTAADYSGATVEPNTMVIIGGTAAVISLIATIIGAKNIKSPKGHRYRVGGGAPL